MYYKHSPKETCYIVLSIIDSNWLCLFRERDNAKCDRHYDSSRGRPVRISTLHQQKLAIWIKRITLFSGARLVHHNVSMVSIKDVC